jgi:hypothetical protein
MSSHVRINGSSRWFLHLRFSSRLAGFKGFFAVENAVENAAQ